MAETLVLQKVSKEDTPLHPSTVSVTGQKALLRHQTASRQKHSGSLEALGSSEKELERKYVIMAALRCARVLTLGAGTRQRLRGLLSPAASRLLPPTRGHRLSYHDDELYQGKAMILHQHDPGEFVIENCSPQGFSINGIGVYGPCAVLPPSILQWNVRDPSDISLESLVLFYLLEPQIEVLVIGTGFRTERLDSKVLEALKKRRVMVEVQDTPNACSTFNFLLSERRLTAAALIPPLKQPRSVRELTEIE
ncbi:hypothetical protein DNTS_010284 [Danionella cerebrum]|uniref:NADH dehydrogenase [ubiquinone] 1 alpha subcomplex assembly factor 3 n=1 Tax=Danionella cerebrum TaxID=2873325 RepID=A0A553MRA1_9TELE|nr:hypothetical protein DNTS_010284 [Danionella translucida]